jgi:hypothetical protein
MVSVTTPFYRHGGSKGLEPPATLRAWPPDPVPATALAVIAIMDEAMIALKAAEL